MLWELIYYAKISLKVTFSAISIIQRTFTKSCLSVQVFLWPCVALRTRWHLATKAACVFLPIGSIYKRWISCMLKYKNIRRTWPFSPVLACKSMNKANLVWVGEGAQEEKDIWRKYPFVKFSRKTICWTCAVFHSANPVRNLRVFLYLFTILDEFFLWTQTYKVTDLSGDGKTGLHQQLKQGKKQNKQHIQKKVKIRHLKGFSQDNSFCLRIPVEPFGTMELPFHDYRSQELQRGTKQGSVLLSGEEPWGRAPGSVQSLCFGLSSATWWNQQIPILPLRLWRRQQKVPNISSHSWKEVLFKKKKRKKATTVSLESHLWTV